MNVELVYVFPLSGAGEFYDYACSFLESYHQFPPDYPHSTTIVCNGARVTSETTALFGSLPEVKFLEHDNSGYDIGGFIAASKQSVAELIVCLGSSSCFFRSGWLNRMVEARIKHGPGVYGSSTSFQEMPHINTTGFWCDPIFLASYPWPVISQADRYSFEQNKPQPNRPFWKFVHSLGKRALLVTWCGEYEWWDWRKPANIFRMGDQSNMLVHWRFSDHWRNYDPNTKLEISRITNNITDKRFNIQLRTMP